MDISVIICGHNEGRLLHRALTSVFKSVEYAKNENQLNIEVIVSLDNPSIETLNYLDNSEFKNEIKIYKNNFQDVALSRNFASEKAIGKYIAFLDGDDLFGETWLLHSYKKAEEYGNECVLHPEYYISFGAKSLIWKRISSIDPSFRYGSLLSFNPWDATIFLHRSVMDKFKFRECPRNSGWGYEDYDFFCNTLGNGISHLITPETVVFIRVKTEGSRLSEHSSSNSTLQANKLFEPNVLRELLKEELNPIRRVKSLKRKILDRYPGIHIFLWKIKNAFFDLIKKPLKNIIYPDWLVREWKNMNVIDPELFPSNSMLREIINYEPKFSDTLATEYVKVCDQVGENMEHLIIVPFIKIGGAEKVLFNFIASLKKLYPEEKISVISTEASDSPWRERLPTDVPFVDIGNISSLSYEEKETLLRTLIIQLKPQNVYNLSSQLAFLMFAKFGKALAKVTKLYVFVFCQEYDNEGRLDGYTFLYLEKCFNFLTKIFTDNNRFINFLCNMYGFDRNKFVSLFQPAEIFDITNKKYSVDEPLKLLWASRLDEQKHPEIVYDIAKRCLDLPIKIDVYGTKVLGSRFDTKKFDSLSNIKYCGIYSKGLKEIVSNYDGFIYTSAYDGMPNVILEAVGVGLPIISSNVGGIGDLLEDKKSALLVNNYNDIEEYRNQIEYALKHRKEFNEYAKVAQEEMQKKHNWKTLEETIKNNLK